MTEEMQKLKPCPFCGPRSVEPELCLDVLAQNWRIDCGGCVSHSGNSKDSKRVIDLWNTRPVEDALQSKLDKCLEALEMSVRALEHPDSAVYGYEGKTLKDVAIERARKTISEVWGE